MSSLSVADAAVCAAMASGFEPGSAAWAVANPLTRESAKTRTAICAINFFSIDFIFLLGPQGLKPQLFLALYGTAEAVPFHNSCAGHARMPDFPCRFARECGRTSRANTALVMVYGGCPISRALFAREVG